MAPVKKLTALFVAGLSGLYLMNLGAGIVELGPDNAPVVGNIDEIIATVLLLRALTYLGIDTQRWLGPRGPLGVLRGEASRSHARNNDSTSSGK